ncbi:hypothetical protein IFM89_016212 [Coptis chinensis]|uniref:Uncharacterized protein n=1 Tax=Coptis chinensis TaxID=261450 RepID=A0A835H6J1_9MAGN|nr:hypothetical protein IFM89_016212 [Coptis chinensis]
MFGFTFHRPELVIFQDGLHVDPSVFHHVGHVLLPASRVEVRRGKRLIFADDCFQFMKAPKQKSMHVVVKASEILSGYQPPQHMNIGQHIAKNVPSLKEFTGKQPIPCNKEHLL